MEENFGNRVLKYISYISFLSIMLGSVVQFWALELKNIWYFSFSNVINDSILILFFLIFLSLGLFWALYLISQVLEYDNFTHIKKKSRNYFRIILTVCMIWFLIYTKLKVYPDRADFSIIVQLFDFAAIAAFYFTTYFLSFIYLQINWYRIYSYFKEKKKFKKLWKSILCIDFVLMIATLLLCIFYMGDAKQLIFTYVVLAGFIYVWNNNSNKNHLDFKRLLQENYIFSFICMLVFFFWIMWGWNIHHEHFKNKCFIDKQWNEINIEYMNDKYIFTNNGTEIYKNDVDKFFQCN